MFLLVILVYACAPAPVSAEAHQSPPIDPTALILPRALPEPIPEADERSPNEKLLQSDLTCLRVGTGAVKV